jgi:hypothetical protein
MFNYTLLRSPTFKDIYKGKVVTLEGDVEKRFNDIKITIDHHEQKEKKNVL